MEYILGIVIGFVAGAGVCAIKNLLIWRGLLKEKDRKISLKQYNRRTFISTLIDIAVLAVVFLTKEMVDAYFPATILFAILGIALARKMAPAQVIMRHVGK